MKANQIKSSLLLLLTAAIWGVAFVAQSVGMDYIGPFSFNAIRSLIGGLVLIPCIWLMNRGKPKEAKVPLKSQNKLWIGGICCGVMLAVASSLQQVGIQYTSVGKAGFITALYIVIVPLLGLLFKKRVTILVWVAVAIAVGGMYLLCMTDGLSIGIGDLLVMACAVCFSIHILVIDYFFPYGRWRKNVLHSVFDQRRFVCGSNAAVGASGPIPDSCGLDAAALRGRFKLRRGIYASDCRSAKS